MGTRPCGRWQRRLEERNQRRWKNEPPIENSEGIQRGVKQGEIGNR